MDKNPHAGERAAALFKKKLRRLSMDLRERDEHIAKRVSHLKAVCEEAEKLEDDVKKDLTNYQIKFDEYLKIKNDYDRYCAALRAKTYAEACEA
jgi:hypothetical protein